MKKDNILPYRGIMPKIHKTCFLAYNSPIIGDVEIGEESNIWYNCVIRGDVAPIKIGERTNIQDGTIIHVSRGEKGQTEIGSDVTIGHKAMIHACTIEDESFVGMNSVIMDNVIVESGAWVAAGALITEGKIVKSGEIWAGYPAKFFRKLTDKEKAHIKISADNYVRLAAEYKKL